jgi:cobalt-precorrin-5B (C1)-methyltransferase
VLDEAGLRPRVTASLLDAIQTHLERRAAEALTIGAVTFSNRFGLLGMTEPAKRLLEEWRAEA